MSRRLRFSLANVLLAVTCIALAIGWWSTVEPPAIIKNTDGPPTDAAIRQLPISIAASEVGDFASGYSWYLSLNSAGDGEMTILDAPSNTVVPVEVTAAQLQALKELSIQERFFALDDQFGEIVPDGGVQSITISVGEWTKTVRIHFLGNWLNYDRAKLPEPARALRVWMLIRSWLQHPNATDTRKYDQAILDAVKGNNP